MGHLAADVIEQLPAWVAAPLAAILGLVALYRCYILPGYLKDILNSERNEQ